MLQNIILGLLVIFVSAPANAADLTEEEAILALRRAGVNVGKTDSGFIVGINPNSDDAPAEVFKNLRFLKDLREIAIHSTRVDERLALLADLPGVTHMTIYNNATDKGLKHLSKHTQMKVLRIHLCEKVSDAGLIHFQTLTRLEELSLTGTKVTKQGINKLYKFLPSAWRN